MGAGYGPNIITDGLVMNLDLFNRRSYGGTGAALKDLSNRKKDATIYNSPTYFANKLIFTNGSSNYIQTQFSSPSSSYTVQIGFKPYSNNVDQRIIGTRTGSTDTVAISAGVNSGYLSAWSGSAWVNIAPISNNQFYELTIVATYASNTKYYLNGVLVYTMNNFRPFPQDAVICSNFIGYGSPLNGAIYYARAYNKILTDEQINIMYSQTSERYKINTLLDDNLVLYLDAAIPESYPLTGTTWTDLSGNSNGTLTNGPTFSFDADGAIVFDGVNDYVNVPNGGGLNNTNTFSIELWFKYLSTTQDVGYSGYGALCARQKNGNWSNNLLNINGADPTTSKLGFRPDLANGTFIQSANNIGMGINHCVITSQTGELKMYINGALSASAATSVTLRDDINIPLAIGAWIGDGGSYSNSSIYIFKVYNRALNLDEVYQSFSAVKGRFGL